MSLKALQFNCPVCNAIPGEGCQVLNRCGEWQKSKIHARRLLYVEFGCSQDYPFQCCSDFDTIYGFTEFGHG